MQLLCFGDSNTYGYDPRSYLGGRYPSDVRWVDRLAHNTGWDIVNDGQNGRMIPVAMPPGFLPQADWLIVMLGTNDLLQGASPREISARMETFLEPTLPSFASILLVAPPPMKHGAWVTENRLLAHSAQLAAQYQALAQRLDIGFADAEKWNIQLTFDGVHFSEMGHQTFAAEIQAALLALQSRHVHHRTLLRWEESPRSLD